MDLNLEVCVCVCVCESVHVRVCVFEYARACMCACACVCGCLCIWNAFLTAFYGIWIYRMIAYWLRCGWFAVPNRQYLSISDKRSSDLGKRYLLNCQERHITALNGVLIWLNHNAILWNVSLRPKNPYSSGFQRNVVVWKLDNITTQPHFTKRWEPLELSMLET